MLILWNSHWILWLITCAITPSKFILSRLVRDTQRESHWMRMCFMKQNPAIINTLHNHLQWYLKQQVFLEIQAAIMSNKWSVMSCKSITFETKEMYIKQTSRLIWLQPILTLNYRHTTDQVNPTIEVTTHVSPLTTAPFSVPVMFTTPPMFFPAGRTVYYPMSVTKYRRVQTVNPSTLERGSWWSPHSMIVNAKQTLKLEDHFLSDVFYIRNQRLPSSSSGQLVPWWQWSRMSWTVLRKDRDWAIETIMRGQQKNIG
jgi:hypothetical protein